MITPPLSCRRRTLLLLASALPIISPAQAAHPGVAVAPAEYQELQYLATSVPFTAMRAAAVADSSTKLVNASDTIILRANALSALMSSNALAYVLETDPAVRATYRDRIATAMTWWNPGTTGNLAAELNSSIWDNTVPPGAAFVNSLLAFDIIEEDPAYLPAARTAALNHLTAVGQWYVAHSSSWKLHDAATRGFWALYTNNNALLNTAKADYRSELFTRITPAGGYNEGNGYAMARSLPPDREQKHFFLDVLEYQGDHTWYSDSRLQNFYQWLVGHAFTPARENWLFGDTDFSSFSPSNTGTVRALNFGPLASAYTARLQGAAPLPGRLLTYLIRARATAPAEAEPAATPRSRLVSDTGAFLWESSSTAGNNALAAVLWNCTSEEAHSHKDTNSINLAAYGRLLLGNAGYAGWNRGENGVSWAYIHDRAVSANTALINYSVNEVNGTPSSINDHVAKYGGGVNGIVSEGLDLVTGNDGPAIGNGSHLRTLAFVHPQDGQAGYFVSFDELTPNISGQTVQLAWHPLSRNNVASNLAANTTADTNRQYLAKITSSGGSDTGVRLTTFLATPPNATGVSIRTGAIGGFGATTYLFCNYDTAGPRTIATVHYPTPTSTAVIPGLTRLAGSSYTGARIGQSDYVMAGSGAESLTATPVSFAGIGVTVNARAAIFRKSGTAASDGVSWYAAKGYSLKDSAVPPNGFSSTQPIHVHVKNHAGSAFASEKSSVVFHDPGRSGLISNGTLLPTVYDPAAKSFRAVLSKGSHALSFVAPTFISSEADASVMDGINADTNYGGNNVLVVQDHPNDDYDSRAYMRFNLSSLTSSVVRATLRLTPVMLSGASSLKIKVLLIQEPSTWIETGTNGITWNNKPATTTEVAELSDLTVYDPVGVDLTAAVRAAQASSLGKVSIALVVSSGADAGRSAQFGSKENGTDAYRPSLLILREADFATSGNLAPAVDGYVNDGVYSTLNYGPSSNLLVKADANKDFDREAFLSFDISGRARPALRSTLRLTPTALGANVNVQVRLVRNPQRWGESSLNWDNKPEIGELIATLANGTLQLNTPVEIDVTSAVNALPAGSTRLSIALVAALPEGANNYASFASKEHATVAWRPNLRMLDSTLLASASTETYSDWLEQRLGEASTNLALAGPSADPDFDGRANLLEYVLGSEPLQNDATSSAPRLVTRTDGSHRFVFTRRYPTDCDLAVEYSNDLIDWEVIAALSRNSDAWAGVVPVVESMSDAMRVVEITPPNFTTPLSRIFFRLTASRS